MNVKEKLNKQNIEDIITLTPMQEGMLYYYLRDPGSEVYFEQLNLEIEGIIKLECFENAWNFIVETNEMLRTTFRWENLPKPVQIVMKRHQPNLSFYDFSGEEEPLKKKLVEDIINEDKRKKFDLNQVPFRITLCKTGPRSHQMIISNHHILYDGWSNGIILGEFFKAYHALINNEELIPKKKNKFKEFIQWIHRQDVTEQEEFWKTYLKDFQIGAKAPEKRKKSNKSRKAAYYSAKIPMKTKNKLSGFVKRLNITAASLLGSAWGVLLQAYNGTTNVLFDTTVSGRNAKIKGIEEMVGFFINTIPQVVRSLPGETISEFLTRLYHLGRQREEFENRTPLHLKAYLDSCNNNLLFDSVVVIENYPLDSIYLQAKGPLTIRSFSNSSSTLYHLTIIITVFDDIKLNVTYDTGIFEEETVRNLVESFFSILEFMIEHPQGKVLEIPVITEEDRDRLRKYLEEKLTILTEGAEKDPSPGDDNFMPPTNLVEERIRDIWSELLRVSKNVIGINSDFFDFGGHSLKASLLVARLQEELQVKVPLSEVFHSPTIKELARYIRNTGRPVEDYYKPIAPVEEKEYYALSAAQKRMYALYRMNPESISYNVSEAFLIDGMLGPGELAAFERALQKLVDRHEILRTSFVQVDGGPVQVVHQLIDFPLEYQEPAENRHTGESDITRIAVEFIQPFHLEEVPLIRIKAAGISAEKHLLLFDTHHIITDGVSMNVFFKEFMALASQEELPTPRIQYKDFSQWHTKRMVSKEIRRQEEFWINKFNGEIPGLNLPADYPVTPERTASTEGDKLYFRVNRKTRDKLRALEKMSGATLYMILLAAYNVILMKYTSQEDIVVGTLMDGRRHADLQQILGVLITTMAMRNCR